MIRAGLACEAARRTLGAYPAQAEGTDPVTGQPLLYRPETRVLYSVGAGGVDDGGEVAKRWSDSKDIVWRLRG